MPLLQKLTKIYVRRKIFCHVDGALILKEVPSGTPSNLIITPTPHHTRLRRSNTLITKLPPLRSSTARRLRTPRASDEADIRANVCRCTEPPTTPCGPQLCGGAPISQSDSVNTDNGSTCPETPHRTKSVRSCIGPPRLHAVRVLLEHPVGRDRRRLNHAVLRQQVRNIVK